MGRLSRLDIGVWCEHWTPDQIVSHLPWLKERGLRLHFAVKSHFQANDFLPLLKEARALGVEVWAWPLLSEAQGYWAGADNAEDFSRRVQGLFEVWEAEGCLPQGVSFDFEPALEVLRAYLEPYEKSRGLSAVVAGVRRLRAAGSAHPLSQALSIYAELTHSLRSRGIGLHAVTTPLVLHDLEEGLGEPQSWKVRELLALPLEPEHYDWVSFMAYRSEYERIVSRALGGVGVNLGSALSGDVAARALKVLGDRASIDVGVLGDIEFPHKLKGFSSLRELDAELHAVSEQGVQRAQVYRLEGWASLIENNAGNENPGRVPRILQKLAVKLIDRLTRVLIRFL